MKGFLIYIDLNISLNGPNMVFAAVGGGRRGIGMGDMSPMDVSQMFMRVSVNNSSVENLLRFIQKINIPSLKIFYKLA